MILYHGSNMPILAIDLGKCRPNKDFGCGFYTTSIQEQAQSMAQRVARRFGGEPVVTPFEFDETCLTSKQLSVRHFAKPCVEWAMFVMNNRSGKPVQGSQYEDNNMDLRYDVVVGPVANDDLSLIFRLFERSLLSVEMLIHEMELRKLTNQYSFHTSKAVALLRRLD